MDDDSLGVDAPCEAGAVNHEYANSLVALWIHCKQRLSAVDETPTNRSSFSGDAGFDWLSVLIFTGSTILGLIVKGDAAMRQIIFRGLTKHDHI
jgi:hypothetical protein